ncbi:MAG: TonB-dependent receptor [Chitinophagaceae bacterium]
MRKSLRFSLLLMIASLYSLSAFSQATTITGTVTNSFTNEVVPAVSVSVRGASIGTFTDERGSFRLNVNSLPVTLLFSSIGFESKEVTVTSADSPLSVVLVAASTLGQEVVVAATRTPQRILESPVSIERVGITAIRNAAVPNYYDLVKNLKGVDLITSSLTFKTVGTRGFNGSGNLRFNQLTDGMDNQAPGLNFSVGSIIGPTELDIDNFELLQGASSALYGSGGTNGTMLLNSKNPFRYQGLSYQVKQGINHINSNRNSPAPYYDWSMRYARAIGDKWAFKISGQLISAQDWEANDRRNLSRTNVFSSIKPGNRQTDPNYDGVNVFGDEASVSMNSLAQAVAAQVGAQGVALINSLAGQGLTFPQIVAGLSANAQTAPLVPAVPFVLGMRNNYYGGQFVSRTGYDERDLVDYNAYNFKLNGGVHYKLTNDIEASLSGYWGSGTTVYTGADRYVLKNLRMGQYKAEVRSANWFLRGYTTQENSGDSYTATTAALFINNAWKPNGTWFQTYTSAYSQVRLAGGDDAMAHATARGAADQGRLIPGTPGFQTAFNKAVNTTINVGGAKFDDASSLYHYEGQYNLSQLVQFADVLVGASFRRYHLNSNGTIFADTSGAINIDEVGGYLQIQKGFLNDVLRLTGSIRYDKQSNFEGRATPRATALIKVAENNNFRLSYQTAYRFPSTQDQYINLLTGGANRLIGGIPDFEEFFRFRQNPAYTSESVVAYRNSISAGTPNPGLLQQAAFQNIKPERANAYELGYRGLLNANLLVDGYVYYTAYKDFLGRVAVGRGNSGDPARAPIDLASPFTTNNISFIQNTDTEVKAIGWGVSANYLLGKGFELSANFSSDRLQDVPAGFVSFFNTPKWKYNIGISNNNIAKGVGFNLHYRRQDDVFWEGTFGTGLVPAYGTLDAQVNYKLPNSNNMLKIGGANITNDYYQSAFGNPRVGGLYYISFSNNF